MPIPEISTSIRDNALGIVAENPDGVHAKVGVCSNGTPNTLYSFADQKTLADTLGTGPLVEAAAHALAVAGGQVLCVPVNASPGTIQGPPAPPPTQSAVNITGAPLGEYQGVIQIAPGSNGLATSSTFRYSLDGGRSFSPEIAIQSGYPIPGTGVVVNFVPATMGFFAGQSFAFTTTAPGFTLSDLNAALEALLADSREWRLVHVVGIGADANAAASIVAMLDAKLTSAENAFRYARGIAECPQLSDSELISAFASFASRRVGVAAGFEDLTSSITGRTGRRSAAWPAVARAMAIPISQDLGAVEDGPLPGVVKLYRDERVTPGLDAKQFITLRTFLGVAGFYVTSGRCMAPVGSDYGLLQNGFVMDAACRTARNALLPFLNSKVRVDATTGMILEADARTIEATVEAALNARLTSQGHASAIEVKVSRSENILSTQRLPVTIRVVPLGYARSIAVDIGFANPALELVTS